MVVLIAGKFYLGLLYDHEGLIKIVLTRYN